MCKLYPEIEIEDDHEKLRGGGGWWGHQNGNPCCILYGMRSGTEGLPFDSPGSGEVFYGKIKTGVTSLGELVHISELEEIEGVTY